MQTQGQVLPGSGPFLHGCLPPAVYVFRVCFCEMGSSLLMVLDFFYDFHLVTEVEPNQIRPDPLNSLWNDEHLCLSLLGPHSNASHRQKLPEMGAPPKGVVVWGWGKEKYKESVPAQCLCLTLLGLFL